MREINQLSPAIFHPISTITGQSRVRKQLNITQRLSDLGVTESDIPVLSKFAFNDPCLATNPRETDVEDIEAVYRQVL